MTPPPESILDDVATNNFIRPRLIGGDYGSDADLEAIYNVNLTGGLADLFPDLDLFADALVRDFADRNAPTGSYPHIFDDTIIVDLPAAVGNQPIGTYPQIYADAVTLNGGTLVATIAMPDGLYETKFYDNIVDGIAPDVFVTPAPFTVVLLGEQPITPTIDLVGDLDGPSVRRCPVDFGSGDLSRRLDQAEVDLNKKIAAGESIDLREYEKLAAEAEQAKQAAYEADRAAGGGIDARPYLQNSDKAGHLLKTAEAAAGTKLETPDLGGTPALIDPNARSPIDLKLSDCVQ
jgi:hypothetical protein